MYGSEESSLPWNCIMNNQAELVMSSWMGERRERVEDDTKIEPRGFVTLRGQIIELLTEAVKRGKRKNLDKDNKQPLQLMLIGICSVDFIHSS